MWSYEFYQDEEGKEPVREFILSLEAKQRGKVLQLIQTLSEFGPILPYPYSSQVEGKHRETQSTLWQSALPYPLFSRYPRNFYPGERFREQDG